MRCIKCGLEVEANKKFCRHCGGKIQEPIPKELRCSKCGIEVKLGEKFCMSCGEKLSEHTPQNIQQEIYIPAPTEQSNPSAQPKQRNYGELKLRILQVLISLVLAALMFFFISLENSVILEVTGNENSDYKFSLLDIIHTLILGTKKYHPSVLSIVIGVNAIIFIFAAAAFWLFTAVATLICKGEKGMRRMAMVLTVYAIGSICTLPYLAYKFISQIKFMYARIVNVLLEDVNGIISFLSLIWAGIVVLCMIAIWILAFQRKKKERVVNVNGK